MEDNDDSMHYHLNVGFSHEDIYNDDQCLTLAQLRQDLQIIETQNIKSLRLHEVSMSHNAIKQLISLPWDFLMSLNLNSIFSGKDQRFKPKTITKIVALNAPRLRILCLNSNNIGASVCKQLMRNKWPISCLSLGQNEIDQQSCEYLSKIKSWNIYYLKMNKNKLNGRSMYHLTQANWTNLYYLVLSYNNIGDTGCKYLARQSKWPKLDTLELSNNNISQVGMKWLAKGEWPSLQWFVISKNSIGWMGINAFMRCEWPNLWFFDCEMNNLRDEGAKLLLNINYWSFHNLQIRILFINVLSNDIYDPEFFKWQYSLRNEIQQ